jgi:hypothetical protein
METSSGWQVKAGEYLQPEIGGGPRVAKKLERDLRAVGIIGDNEFLVPSKYMQLDANGNIPKGVTNQIRANLRTSRYDTASHSSRGGSRRPSAKKFSFFYFTRRGIKGQKLTAIWELYGRGAGSGHTVPALIVVKAAPKYKKIFDMQAVVERDLDEKFAQAFAVGMEKALATAR